MSYESGIIILSEKAKDLISDAKKHQAAFPDETDQAGVLPLFIDALEIVTQMLESSIDDAT